MAYSSEFCPRKFEKTKKQAKEQHHEAKKQEKVLPFAGDMKGLESTLHHVESMMASMRVDQMLMNNSMQNSIQKMEEKFLTLSKKIDLTSKQGASLAQSTGRLFARHKMKELARAGGFPFSMFKGVASRGATTWKNLHQLCRYLDFSDGEEAVVLSKLCTLLTPTTVRSFLLALLTSVNVSRQQFNGSFPDPACRLIETCKGKVRKCMLTNAVEFFEALHGATDNMVMEAREAGRISLDSPFLFMLFVWLFGKRFHKHDIIRKKLQVDMQGMCLRKETGFVITFGEIMSSRGQIHYAKFQMDILSHVCLALVDMLEARQCVVVKKVILVFGNPIDSDSDEEGKGIKGEKERDAGGFLIIDMSH